MSQEWQAASTRIRSDFTWTCMSFASHACISCTWRRQFFFSKRVSKCAKARSSSFWQFLSILQGMEKCMLCRTYCTSNKTVILHVYVSDCAHDNLHILCLTRDYNIRTLFFVFAMLFFFLSLSLPAEKGRGRTQWAMRNKRPYLAHLINKTRYVIEGTLLWH